MDISEEQVSTFSVFGQATKRCLIIKHLLELLLLIIIIGMNYPFSAELEVNEGKCKWFNCNINEYEMESHFRVLIPKIQVENDAMNIYLRYSQNMFRLKQH
jgi:hypothetical protein